MANSHPFDLAERLLEFAVSIVRLTEEMLKTRASNHVAGQLLRSGTSPLPNHGEAQAAESNADFIHKMSICLKELRETERWLLLVERTPLVEHPERLVPMLAEADALIRIFKKSILTAQAKASAPPNR